MSGISSTVEGNTKKLQGDANSLAEITQSLDDIKRVVDQNSLILESEVNG